MMKMSLLTNSLTDVGLKDLHPIADWAAENGIYALDVGPAIAMDRNAFEEVLGQGKITINAMIYTFALCRTGHHLYTHAQRPNGRAGL